MLSRETVSRHRVYVRATTRTCQLLPGSFHFVTMPTSMDQLTSKLTYFSFGTLTNVGSDIIPVRAFARSLTTAEGIVGQLFPAILIGALVSMAMESARKS